MKYSKNNKVNFKPLNYIKDLCFKSILLVLIYSCSFKGKAVEAIEPTIKHEPTVIEPTEEQELREEKSAYRTFNDIVLGASRMHLYLDSLKGKRIALVANQTTAIGNTHLVDSLLSLGIQVVKVFSPEHGFRGDADAGEKVGNYADTKTGIQIISLYGNNKKPHPEQLADVDFVIYDIQDVGVRFYTYISTLHYVMEACAENNRTLIVLDRPNPNGHYIDGPVREEKHKSFIGMDPVPIVYGMTVGEYALMLNGENWLENGAQCPLWIVPCKHYMHKSKYVLPIPPSPNLRSEVAINLYPSLCFFEATTVSVGRGTEKPFEIFGHPNFPNNGFTFTPVSSYGAKSPLWENTLCNGKDLSNSLRRRSYEINLSYLIEARSYLGDSIQFIKAASFFDRLAGTSDLMEQILAGKSESEIRDSWKEGIENFKLIRQKYLLYR
jgi:uncharacterized protein YbbC (DUF1343 family)